MLFQHGTGPASVAFVHPSAIDLLRTNPIAYLTFDKPGVRAPFGDPAALRRDDAAFERHTQGHLLECAKQALEIANERFGASVQVHLRGHSEGALISLYLLDALLEEQPERARQIRSLVLTGLPLEPFSEILERQLDAITKQDRGELRTAIANCNWPVMRDRLGFSCAYLRDAASRPSGFEMFRRLAARSVAVPIHVFQGEKDFHTPAAEVRKLEQWNAEAGHLDLTVGFYDGGHRGTPEVQEEVKDLYRRLLSKEAR
jgi:pimeloyl-ACP methyl ester carboxylesterase